MGAAVYFKRLARYLIKGIPVNNVSVNVVTQNASNRLQGQGVLITGGGKGLGYYIAKKCIEEGANVIISGRNEDVLKNATKQLGEQCRYIVFDVKDVNGDADMIDEAESIIGVPLTCLVSNAGVSLHEGNFRNVTSDGWDTQLNTNLKGNYFLVKSFIEHLEKRNEKKGNILVVTSERAMRPDDIPYGLTKVASNNFIKAMSVKVIKEGIRINGIAPGVTATDMTGFSKDGNLFNSWQNNERIFIPEEVAEVAAFLLSDVSACISGEIIACDQGNYISVW